MVVQGNVNVDGRMKFLHIYDEFFIQSNKSSATDLTGFLQEQNHKGHEIAYVVCELSSNSLHQLETTNSA